jgi:hypothetical protein
MIADVPETLNRNAGASEIVAPELVLDRRTDP